MAQSMEFSHQIMLDDLPKGGRHFKLEASEQERSAAASRLGVLAVDALGGEIKVVASRKRFDLSGRVVARLRRECVASLEEIEEAIDETFEVSYLRKSAEEFEDEEISLDTPEFHDEPQFDLGDFLVQQVSLAMDPFPRKAGVKSLAVEFGEDSELSPFAQALEEARKNEENQ